MAGFIYKLQNIINASPDNDDIDINFSRCLLKNIHSINKKTSLQEFANICYTSQSSMSRFSQKLGYDNFSDFKYDCVNVREELQELMLDNLAFHDLSLNQFGYDISSSLTDMQETFSVEEVNKLCAYIHNANHIYIFATHVPGDLANILQRGLLVAGKSAEFYPRKEHQIKVVRQINKDDLCIFFSLEGTLLMEKAITIPAIMSLATCVLVTQNIHIKFSDQFTQVIGLGKHDHETLGKYKLLFLIDCVLHQYYRNYIVPEIN